MPLYVADYKADTAHLSCAEHGAYLLLIMHYWQRGSLPDDDSRLASIASASLEQWLSMKPVISEFFVDGWRHERIDEELRKSTQAYERRANAGRKGGLATHQKSEQCSSNAQAMLKQSHPQPLLVGNLRDSGSGNILDLCPKPASPVRTRNQYPDDFLKFWGDYPTDANMSKAEAAKAWARLPDDDRQLATKSVGAFRAYCAAHPDYRPVHANRYLTQRRFEGHGQITERSATVSAVVKQGTPQGQAWERYTRQTKSKGVPWTNGVWRFPSEWPPVVQAADQAFTRETIG